MTAPVAGNSTTPWIDHGSVSTRWTPDDGGTAELIQDSPNSAFILGGFGLGLGVSIGGIVKSNRAAVAAKSAALASGATDDVARLAGRSASNRWAIGATLASAGLVLGGAALADAFGSTKHSEQSGMSRAEYDKAVAGMPETSPTMFGTMSRIVGMQLTGAAGAMVAGKLLSGAPKAVQVGGLFAGYLAGGLLGYKGIDAGADALGI